MKFRLFHLLFFLIFFSCDMPAQSDETEKNVNALLDTIQLKNDIDFNSDLASRMENCSNFTYNSKPLTREKVLHIQNLFNRELKSTKFNKIAVVTGKNVKFENTENWCSIMEWHFETSEITDQIEQLLRRLKGGEIRHTIYPNQCSWTRSGNKIYVFHYRVVKGDLYWVDDFYDCFK